MIFSSSFEYFYGIAHRIAQGSPGVLLVVIRVALTTGEVSIRTVTVSCRTVLFALDLRTVFLLLGVGVSTDEDLV